MTPSTSNIIPFPIHRGPKAVVPPAPERLPELAIVASVARTGLNADEHAAHVAAVVRASIGFARRKGVRLDSLPPQLRSWLLDLCEKGDPTCRMVRDWLIGNRRCCASGAIAATTNTEEVM